jgi:2-oxoisovalerate dehydrogenase E1 component alpha subunit
MQKRHGGEGITIVTGGDAGTHEGDFQSCLVWSTRPGNELPVLMIVMNNGWGISVSACSQHAEKNIVDRGQAFGIPGEVTDGNDPVASWHSIARAMAYCREERRPYLLEARVSRLYGHSSSSGAVRVEGEPDCIELLEHRLLAARHITKQEVKQIHDAAESEAEDALEQALREPRPTPEDVPRGTYAASKVDQIYPGDYTGLPQ